MSVPAPARTALTDDPAIRKILVIKWSALGDLVIASALLEDLARAFPRSTLHLNTLPQWRHLFEQDPRLHEVLAIDVRANRLASTRAWLRAVASARYDLIVDLQGSDHSRLLLALLRMTRGAPRHCLGAVRRYPYTLGAERPSDAPHAFDRMRAAFAAAGIAPVATRPVLAVPPESRARAARLMQEHGLAPGRYAVLFPGSQAAGHLKRWGAARYAELARRLHERGLAPIVLIGGPDEIDECARIEAACGPWLVNLCGRTAIPDIIPLCEGARVMIANDTGTAHVAAATGRPLLVICGPTDPRRVRPIGTAVRTVQADLPCINCYRKTCSHHSCMPAITPERVMGELGEWLG